MRKNKNWFLLIYVIIITSVMLLTLTYSSTKIQINYDFFYSEFNKYFLKNNSPELRKTLIIQDRDFYNTDSVVSDVETCDTFQIEFEVWWNVRCYNSSAIDPTPFYTSVQSWSDNINDSWDNDDFKCQYFEDIDASKIKLDTSKKCDNDDAYRLEINNIVWPLENSTAIVLDSETLSLIQNNSYNSWTYVNGRNLPSDWNFKIKVDLSNTNAKLHLFKIDKSINDSTKYFVQTEYIISALNSTSWEIQMDWSLWSWNEYNFDTTNNYYVILIENTSENTSLNYNISAQNISTTNPIYITPINDSGEEDEFNLKEFYIENSKIKKIG